MIAPKPIVFVIDDDASVRKGLSRLLDAAGYRNETLASAGDFLRLPRCSEPSCVIVDVRMPGLNGIDFQETLVRSRRQEQLIFITGHGNVPMCARAMKAGAVDFLPKPFKSEELLECIERALIRSSEQRSVAAEKDAIAQLLNSLTPREFEVMQGIGTGMLNKQVAAALGIAEKTVKVHRGRVMQKLGITSVAELVHYMHKAGVRSKSKS